MSKFLAGLSLLVAAFIVLATVLLLLPGFAGATPGDTVADRVFGQGGSFTSNACPLVGVSATNLCSMTGAAVDAAGHLYIVDSGYQRVLEYDNPLTSSTADRVFGQGGSFSSYTCNLGGISATSLCGPQSVTVDAGRLYIADGLNHRVLEYDNPLTSQVADRVFGQGGSFTSNTINSGGVSASSLYAPQGVSVDADGKLYVTDSANNRLLEYDSPLTSSVADRVFGQGGSFTSNTMNLGGVSASSLRAPMRPALDTAGHLYVADNGNSRVLEYDNPLTSQVADRVFGQGGSFSSYTCNLGGVSASSLCQPSGVAVTTAGDALYVADDNNRVLEYDSPLTNSVADRVFGQGGSFTTNTSNLGGISASSLAYPFGVAVDASDRLYIADYQNNRELEYDNPLATPTASPTPTPSPTPTSSPSPTPTASSLPTPTASPSPTPTTTPSGQTPSPTLATTATPTPTPTPTPMPTPTATTPPLVLKGDANCNGLVTMADILTMLAVYAGVPESLNAGCHPDLDLNCDGVANAKDIIAFLWTEADLVWPTPSACAPIGTQVG